MLVWVSSQEITLFIAQGCRGFKMSMPKIANDGKIRGVPTLRISVSGERQNLFGNLKILPGIGSLEKLFGKLQIILEYYIIYIFYI